MQFFSIELLSKIIEHPTGRELLDELVHQFIESFTRLHIIFQNAHIFFGVLLVFNGIKN